MTVYRRHMWTVCPLVACIHQGQLLPPVTFYRYLLPFLVSGSISIDKPSIYNPHVTQLQKYGVASQFHGTFVLRIRILKPTA
jgi:hypothetical protein